MPELPPDPRDWCEGCGTRLPDDAFWGRRKYCSAPCRSAHYTSLDSEGRREARKGRPCQHCGGPIPADRTAQARFCGKKCVDAAFYQRNKEAVLARNRERAQRPVSPEEEERRRQVRREARRKWRQENPEKARERDRRNYERFGEAKRRRQREQRKAAREARE